MNIFLRKGGEDDDSCGGNIRGVLAALPRVLRHHIVLPGRGELSLHTGDIFGYILACYEQFYV